jgi:hypothetical protein
MDANEDQAMKINRKVWVWIALGAVALAAALMLLLRQPSGQAREVLVTVDGAAYRRLALTDDTDETFTVETEWGYNVVIIRDGAVDVTEADCPNQICVNTKPAREIGDMIVCLPHKMVVEIVPGGGAP